MEQKDSMAGPFPWLCFILSFSSVENSCIFRQSVLTCILSVSAETERIHSLWHIFEKISTCAVGCSFEHPTAQVEKFITLIKVLNKQAIYLKKLVDNNICAVYNIIVNDIHFHLEG